MNSHRCLAASAGIAGIAVFAVLMVPRHSPGLAHAFIRSLGVFLALLAFAVAGKSQKGMSRVTAVIYGLFFSVHALFGLIKADMVSFLVGFDRAFVIIQYGNVVYCGLLTLLSAFLLLKVVAKYRALWEQASLAGVITVLLVGTYSYPFLKDPHYVYTVPEITDFRIIDRAKGELISRGLSNPLPEDLAQLVALSEWEGVRRIGELSAERERARIAELLPYTIGNDYIALVNRPLHALTAVLSLFCVLMLTIFLGLKYIHDPPDPAHMEKIHFTLLLYCVLEYVHALALFRATSFLEVTTLDEIGKYVTALVMILFAVFFYKRLAFLGRSEGTYYERRIATDAGSISRWRDGIDELVIHRFAWSGRFARRLAVKRRVQGASHRPDKTTEQ
ncbi:MAG: hypothetical protein HBSIN02_05970 [Bacteroidia bacterium]|nr:MAG: hypothetical protein HBSIN02_05970 [Bacteroidia bacterium]